MLTRNLSILQSDLHFTVMGDVHAEQHPDKTEANLRSMAADNACFATLLGDLTSDGTRESYERHFYPLLKYRPARLLSCFGNHDHFSAWRRIFGGLLYYSWHIGDCSFLWLYNSNERGIEQDKQQWEWLNNELSISGKNIFCFAHCPPSVVDRWKYHSFNALETHKLLVNYKVNMFFAGHIHAFDYECVDGINYVLTGGGGGNLYNLGGQSFRGTSPHYIHVAVGEKIRRWRIINRGIFQEEEF